MPRIWLVLLLLIWGTRFAYADGDIVYAARYYLPPGSKGTSHFHLYRINPDGTGKRQITFGKYDDDNPVWSPNGQEILFIREALRADREDLCLISARGGPITRLLNISTYGWPQYAWSPDNQEIAVTDGSVSLVDILDVKTHKQHHFRKSVNFCWSPDGRWYYVDDGLPHFVSRQTHISMHAHFYLAGDAREYGGQAAVWAGDQAIVGIDCKPESKQVYLTVLNRNGVQKRRVLCHWPNVFHLPKNKHSPMNDPYSEIESINAGRRSLLPLMHSRGVVYVQAVGDSGTSPANTYWRADTVTGKMTEITEGQFLTWASNGQRFVLHRRITRWTTAKQAKLFMWLPWRSVLSNRTSCMRLSLALPGSPGQIGADPKYEVRSNPLSDVSELRRLCEW